MLLVDMIWISDYHCNTTQREAVLTLIKGGKKNDFLLSCCRSNTIAKLCTLKLQLMETKQLQTLEYNRGNN